jgi:hypothetical protein
VSVRQVLSDLGVPEAADGDGVLHTRISLHTVSQLKDLLDGGLTPQQRTRHAEALLAGITAPTAPESVALTHRLIRHVVGTGELSEQDHAQLAAALPITAHVITQPNAAGTAPPADGGAVPPPTGAPMQVSTVWDVSTRDGSLQVIDLSNGVELLDGGCIVARATPLHFTCSSFTRVGGPPAGFSGDFNILGAAGAPVATAPTPPGGLGQASAGAPGQCIGSMTSGGPGAAGQAGTTGAPGARGNDGVASALASITITDSLTLDGAVNKVLVVATQSGTGGPGGDGSPGAPGQQGGNGGNGAICQCSGSPGGNAGAGGPGGTGGPGGEGGNGTDAAGNITVFLPHATSPDLVRALPVSAPPGKPGNPGPGGPGGPSGAPGAPGKNNSSGTFASSGPAGQAGLPGNPGSHVGTPAQVIVTVM